MDSLLYLRIMLALPNGADYLCDQDIKVGTLKPLCAVTQVQRFQVAVPWEDHEETRRLLGNPPFSTEFDTGKLPLP